MWKKRKRSSRTIFSSLEGSVANSTRSERCCVRFWETRDCYGEESEKIPLLGSNSDILNNDRCYDTYEEDQTNVAFTSREWTIIPAQKDEDVTGIVYHGTGQDQSDIQRLITNFKINIAFLWKSVRRLKAFRYSPNMPIEEGQVYGPAQKEKDVINMVNYAKIFDKDYAEKLASDELINSARLKKTIPRLKPQPSFYVAGPRGTNVSDVDVLKGSSWIPTWGIRKRSRIRKQKPSNE
ncbi:uncharacterized protein LOC134723000 [Mytilus trossulus]|uniref:uncharacterized protein LOC134723000 n=1 Tax=Mytilus trossulus TaxID=6551 RepID=UPI003004F36D